MKTITKTAIIGSAGLIAAYLLLSRTRRANGGEVAARACGGALMPEAEIGARFARLPLKAHDFLAGIPLHSLDYTELAGGFEAMTIADLYRAAGLDELGETEMSAATKALFDLRGLIGKILGWDEVPQLVEAVSYLPRLNENERARSLVPPSETRGISRVIYCFENEMLLEIINKTVHCFWLLASERTPDGYGLYNAVYVRNLNWRTPIYMTMISPVLKRVIYPAIGRSIRQHWKKSFPEAGAPSL